MGCSKYWLSVRVDTEFELNYGCSAESAQQSLNLKLGIVHKRIDRNYYLARCSILPVIEIFTAKTKFRYDLILNAARVKK
jgi:hypothetical protein